MSGIKVGDIFRVNVSYWRTIYKVVAMYGEARIACDLQVINKDDGRPQGSISKNVSKDILVLHEEFSKRRGHRLTNIFK